MPKPEAARFKKGSFVYSLADASKQGVIENAPEEDHAFIRWFIRYEPCDASVDYYIEWVSFEEIAELPKSHEGLEFLRMKVMKDLT